MAVAWIARRDFELVREQDLKFCSECFHWISRERKVRPQKGGEPVKRMEYFLEARPAPTVSRLALLDIVLRVRGNVPSTAVITIREAEAELWRALSEGHLTAKGFNTHGVVVDIPSREWAYLRLCEVGGRDVLSYDGIGRPEPFTAVTLRQSDVLRLWPVTGEFPDLPATVIDKGGRPAEHTVKVFAQMRRVISLVLRPRHKAAVRKSSVSRTCCSWNFRMGYRPISPIRKSNALSSLFLKIILGNCLQLTLSPVPGAGERSADTQIRKYANRQMRICVFA